MSYLLLPTPPSSVSNIRLVNYIYAKPVYCALAVYSSSFDLAVLCHPFWETVYSLPWPGAVNFLSADHAF